MATAMVHLCQW